MIELSSMDSKKKLIIIGAGGYAKSVLDSIDANKYMFVGFIDDRLDKSEHLGYPVLAHNINDIINREDYIYFIAIGDNKNRKNWFNRLKENNLRLINVIDKSAIVSKMAKLGEGCFVGKMAIINSCAIIGDDTIINTKSLVEHGCTVGNHVNISTNTVINGDVVIGDGTVLYSGTTVIGQRSVGKWSIVGAGAVVTKNIGDNVVAVGVPARIIKESK